MTTNTVVQGQLLSFLPLHAVLSPHAVYDAPLEGLHEASLTPYHLLAVLLLYEDGNPQSQWRPYLDVLPRRFDPPLPSMYSPGPVTPCEAPKTDSG